MHRRSQIDLDTLGSHVSHGFIRLDMIVLVPELAILGSDLIAVAVLEDPDTRDWFGEDPIYPGSALVAIDRDRVAPPTPEAQTALGPGRDLRERPCRAAG